MKAKIILAIVCTSLSVCERQQRSTVLTDESKRILEQFDFSNFDKQEALNYIDRQRYENQIRGKRSQCKLKRNQNGRHECTSDMELRELTKGNSKNKLLNSNFKLADFKERERRHMTTKHHFLQPIACNFRYEDILKEGIRTKRGHSSKKKKHMHKSYANEYGKEGKRRRKKKKKRKKRHYWGSWSEWSPCSVTCGRGRKIRWRKCIIKNCTKGELEMGEKTCQLPACNLLTKLLGL